MKTLIAGWLLLCCPMLCSSDSDGQAPIQIHVGSGNSVTVTIPNFDKSQLSHIITGTFFGREDYKAAKEFKAVIGKASTLTLVITSKLCDEATPFWNPVDKVCQSVPYCPPQGCAPTPAGKP